MENRFEDRGDGSEYPHKFSSQKMIERAYVEDELKVRKTHIALKALGDLPLVCDVCGDVCDEHAIKVRDAFFYRALQLVEKLGIGVDIYLRERDFGVSEPVETINAVYKVWSELACLHELVEPQPSEVMDIDEEDEENLHD